MRKHKLLTVTLALDVAAIAFLLWPRDRITWEYFECIRAGMSKAEVEAIIGPPGDYRTGPGGFAVVEVVSDSPGISACDRYDVMDWIDPSGQTVYGVWDGDQGHICIVFTPKGAGHKDFCNKYKKKQSPIANLLWRARHQWRRWFPPNWTGERQRNQTETLPLSLKP